MLKQEPKFRKKFQKRLRHIRGNNSKCNTLNYGNFGIQSLEGGFLKFCHLECIRILSLRIARTNKDKNANLRFRVSPVKSFGSKPEQVRMGGGKADIKGWETPIKKDTVIVEFLDVTEETAKKICKQLQTRMPIKIHLLQKSVIILEEKANDEL